MSETTLEQRYTDLLVQITNALGEDFRLMTELDEVVGERLVKAEDQGCSPRIIEAAHRLEAIELEFERLRTVVAMMGHLADHGGGSTS